MKRIFTNEDINKIKGNIKLLHIAYKEKVKKNKKLSKELSDLKELILKTINIFEIALELKEIKSK